MTHNKHVLGESRKENLPLNRKKSPAERGRGSHLGPMRVKGRETTLWERGPEFNDY